MHELITKDVFLNAEDDFVFYMYDRNSHIPDDPGFYTLTCTVTTTENGRFAEGRNAAAGAIHLPLDEKTFDAFTEHPIFGRTFFATRDGVTAQYETEQEGTRNAYANLSKTDILSQLFTGWYGEFDRSDAEKEGMLDRLTLLFDVERKDITRH